MTVYMAELLLWQLSGIPKKDSNNKPVTSELQQDALVAVWASGWLLNLPSISLARDLECRKSVLLALHMYRVHKSYLVCTCAHTNGQTCA